MFLGRVRAKGKTYLYLKKYCIRENYEANATIIYAFGRIDNALSKMYEWKNDFSSFPLELKQQGCTKKDLLNWIDTLESGIHKRSGRSFIHQQNIYEFTK
ncbi:hypothetical protein [Gracilibacillus suaedae]|uniref:hypothetical protein n=1 Tax=Gracilibacillus suaedae TaxID=2820273 RepID=UPI001ABECEAA|nr:hypothetical protein [Gracilibacillus suaedae]